MKQILEYIKSSKSVKDFIEAITGTTCFKNPDSELLYVLIDAKGGSAASIIRMLVYEKDIYCWYYMDNTHILMAKQMKIPYQECIPLICHLDSKHKISKIQFSTNHTDKLTKQLASGLSYKQIANSLLSIPSFKSISNVAPKLEEKFVNYMHSPYGNEERKTFTILLDPTKEEIEKIEEEDFDQVAAIHNPWATHFYLRAMIVGDKLYVWNGDSAEHFFVAQHMGVEKFFALELFFPESEHPLSMDEAYKVVKVVYKGQDDFSFYKKDYPSGSVNPEEIELIKKNRALKLLCSSSVKWEDDSK